MVVTYLLDSNVLVALLHLEHTKREDCVRWYSKHHGRGWATSPMVENGAIRVLANPKVSGGAFLIPQAVDAIERLKQSPGHRFLADDISIADRAFVDRNRLEGIKQVNDAFLIGLCRKHGLKLATTDHRIEPALAPGEGIVELI
jgi:toxin-antitoxin system PIN domain toxin